jgi:hypothetical protein
LKDRDLDMVVVVVVVDYTLVVEDNHLAIQ